MLRAAFHILVKDTRLRVRDRSVWLFAFIVPLGLTFLFSSIFPDTDTIELTAGVVDLDGGEVAAGFVDGVVPSLVDAGVVTRASFEDEQQARAQVAEGAVDAVWVLPAGFSEAVLAGQDAQIDVLVTAGSSLPGELARGVAEAYARRIEQVGLALAVEGAVTAAAPSPQLVGAIGAAATEAEDLIRLSPRTSDVGEPLDPLSYLAAGMAAFFVFFVVPYGITGLLEERQLGTMPRLLAAPIVPGAIQLSKLLGAFLLGIISMTVLSVASHLLLGAEWGPPAGIAILIVALVLAAMAVMSLVAVFAHTAEQAGNYQAVVAIVLGLSGGVFFPIPGDAAVLRVVTSLSPHGWFLRGMNSLAASAQWSAVLPAAGAILLFGAVTAVPAVVLQRRRSTW
ncbi:MAG: ABC transporter permease [Nitriliruptoraceae bacterium]